MRQRLTALGLMTAVLAGLMAAGANGQSAADKARAKKALQEVQEFIGVWNLEGTQKVGTKTEAWKEKINWSWKFDKDAAWITVELREGQVLLEGGPEVPDRQEEVPAGPDRRGQDRAGVRGRLRPGRDSSWSGRTRRGTSTG